MKYPIPTRWAAAVAGLALMAAPGCSAKWLSSGGESELPNGRQASSADAASDGDTDLTSSDSSERGGAARESADSSDGNRDDAIPSLSAKGYGGGNGEGGPLRGFERLAPGETPSEERLSAGGIASRMLSNDVMDKRMAELQREEEAAIAAGFKDAFFGYDRTSIDDDAHAALSSDAEWIKNHPAAKVKVSGHCDERGTQDYNLVLGDKRAKAVKRYLVDLGVNPAQLATVSFGKNRPFCAAHDESCYRQNRRGHFLLSAQ